MNYGSSSFGSTTFGGNAPSLPSSTATPVVNLIIKGNRVTYLIQSRVVILQPRLPFK